MKCGGGRTLPGQWSYPRGETDWECFPAAFTLKQSNPVISTNGSPSQLSDAVAVNEMGASRGVISAGALHWITGAVVSTTVIVCTQLEALTQLSVAVQVRSIVDSPPHAPGVTESEKPTNTVGSHTSELPAVPVLAGAVDSSHSIVISAGQTISGAVVSEMLAVLESVSVCPPETH